MPIEGSKDALTAVHFADAEGRLSQIGVVAALGAGVKPLPDDVEKFRGRRVRIFGDADPAGEEAVSGLPSGADAAFFLRNIVRFERVRAGRSPFRPDVTHDYTAALQ
jgi:hypothetical protein